ncbi:MULTISPECIES: hypothetical protein [Glutamicibacter]|uniref:DUF2017 domain-containing protein n=1 Tax=Glutamicibacter arilaitensis (strain DSM 16368 / CIP 108037 / IAM 15318 / JCM 13566 / NCIMB 14258 / Re117) TaxID=861360 RepID=A0ABM9PU99_GLUAR|nr:MULTISPECIES: hypothetical protein [Glutamicibacter]CBT74762.1 hypothetical protein AARI_05350 [Glutamicibacter arilaitensis Re117]HCJ54983.1 hypothetical protein [Glutamicibacter sp.]
MEQPEHHHSSNEDGLNNEALPSDAQAFMRLRRHIQHLGSAVRRLVMQDGDIAMDADNKNLRTRPSRFLGGNKAVSQDQREFDRPEVSNLTIEDMAKSVFLAALERAKPWRLVAAGELDPGILDIPESLQDYMRSDDGLALLEFWHETLHGSFDGDFREFEGWILSGRNFDSSESSGLLELADLIDGWIAYLRKLMLQGTQAEGQNDDLGSN